MKNWNYTDTNGRTYKITACKAIACEAGDTEHQDAIYLNHVAQDGHTSGFEKLDAVIFGYEMDDLKQLVSEDGWESVEESAWSTDEDTIKSVIL